jgi:hypothetical protein
LLADERSAAPMHTRVTSSFGSLRLLSRPMVALHCPAARTANSSYGTLLVDERSAPSHRRVTSVTSTFLSRPTVALHCPAAGTASSGCGTLVADERFTPSPAMRQQSGRSLSRPMVAPPCPAARTKRSSCGT